MALTDFQTKAFTPDPDRTAFLVVDTESIPDGELIAAVKYPGEDLTSEEAILRAQKEQLEKTNNESDFIPVTFQIPVGVCVVRVGVDFHLQAFTCLDAPHFRTQEIAKKFWIGVAHYKAKLVTFNGRGFDMPLLELAAFRHGLPARDHYLGRDRYRGPLDLQEFFSNFGGCRVVGGLNLLAKMLGLPGKMDTRGDQVYEMFREGRLQDINDYCLCDTLDTYFIFLRTRVLIGEITRSREAEIIRHARDFLDSRRDAFPVLGRYLDSALVLS